VDARHRHAADTEKHRPGGAGGHPHGLG
jgi:hypothetical protein